MEIELRELIDQIKKDGVDAAESEADAIIKSAKEQAERIISDAKAQADKMILNAKNENERMVKSSEDAIRQAGRNLLISFRESITKELEAILGESVSAVYSSEALAQIIVKVIEGAATNTQAESITVILNSEDLKSLESIILSALKSKMLTGVTLKAGDNFSGGFRISADNGHSYYDYSAETVVEMLSAYLSPAVAKLMKEAE